MSNKLIVDNESISQILIDIAVSVFRACDPEDLSASLSVQLEFDDQQRVSKYNNLTFNDTRRILSFDSMENINKIAKKLLELPEKYKLRSLGIEITPGGNIKTSPKYRL